MLIADQLQSRRDQLGIARGNATIGHHEHVLETDADLDTGGSAGREAGR